MIEDLTEDTVVKVGTYYYVPCAIMQRTGDGLKYMVPIIGIAHDDKAFSSLGKHYHVDGRFVSEESKHLFFNKKHGATNQVCEFKTDTYTPYSAFIVEIVVAIRKCKRLVTGVMPPPRNMSASSAYWKWYDAMIGKSCKGKKCPHLGTVMHEKNGVLVCPLHDLHGCKHTEKIIYPDGASSQVNIRPSSFKIYLENKNYE